MNYENYLKEIFTTIIKDNKALEINFKVQQTINDDNHLKALLNMYKKYGGVKLTLSSDAHFLDQIDSYYNNQERIMCIIKECGFNQLSYFVKRKEYIYEI